MIMGALMTETIATNLHEFSKFINVWSALFDETTELKKAEVSKRFFLRMADSYISEGRYAEAIDIYNKLFENIPFNTSVLQRAKEMESLLTIIGKGKQGTKWIEKFRNSANQDKMSFTDIFPILPAGDRRAYKRIAFVKALRFYITVLDLDMERLEKVYYTGASVDISKEGISTITDCLLLKGDVMFFEPEIKEHDIAEKAAIVRWVKEIQKKKYRVGLMFI
jgi:tetratricopeptide (TPR) repeat protein